MLQYKPKTLIRLPEAHKNQEIFVWWNDPSWEGYKPEAQFLVAPCGTKSGKSFGSAIWLAKEAVSFPGLFCVWIGPTYLKCKIGFRYLKAMLPDCKSIDTKEGKLEIHLGNGSFIKFLHGKDAEVTVEGEAIDRAVIDESGKQQKQLWFSLLTTFTQTRGLGIITGTPRGRGWYHDVYRQAQDGDSSFHHTTLPTVSSPYVTQEAVDQAKRLLPKHLFDQYYLAKFVSASEVFGSLDRMWDESLKIPSGPIKFWLHPDPATREKDTIHGFDIAKLRDFSVFYSVNTDGKLTGFCRFNRVPYTMQVTRLKTYVERYFKGDSTIRYDATGVGTAVSDMIVEADIDASIEGVTFTNRSKQEMLTKTIGAIEMGWHKAPCIPVIDDEFSNYEVKLSRSGLFSYGAFEGHDDVVSAAMLSISGAYHSDVAEKSEMMLDRLLDEKIPEEYEMLENYAKLNNEDDFFDTEKEVEETAEDFFFGD